MLRRLNEADIKLLCFARAITEGLPVEPDAIDEFVQSLEMHGYMTQAKAWRAIDVRYRELIKEAECSECSDD